MSSLWLLGIGLELISTLSGTVGKQLIRWSELQKKMGNEKAGKVALQIGLFISTVLVAISDLSAYAFAPQALLAPFAGLDIVWNILSAPYTLGEELTKKRISGIGLVFLGITISVFFSPKNERVYDDELVGELLASWRTLMYVLGFSAWFVFNRFVLMRRPDGDVLRGVSYGVTAGTLAGNMFFLKCLVELLKTSFGTGSGKVWINWPSCIWSYLVLVGAPTVALTNVIYMAQGMKQYEALFMVTIYEGSMVCANAVSSWIVLSEFDGSPAWRILCYFACIGTIVLGMLVLILGEKVQKPILEPEVEYDEKNLDPHQIPIDEQHRV